MGTYEDLKAAIADVIYQNGNNEITGLLLQQTLLSIVNNLGEYATFGGIATPDTNPGTADQNVYYLATIPGEYVNFNYLVVGVDEAVILSNKTGQWIKHVTGYSTQIGNRMLSNIASRGIFFDKDHFIGIDITIEYAENNLFDCLWIVVKDDVGKITINNATILRYVWFKDLPLNQDNYIGNNVTGEVLSGAKFVIVNLRKTDNPQGYDDVFYSEEKRTLLLNEDVRLLSNIASRGIFFDKDHLFTYEGDIRRYTISSLFDTLWFKVPQNVKKVIVNGATITRFSWFSSPDVTNEENWLASNTTGDVVNGSVIGLVSIRKSSNETNYQNNVFLSFLNETDYITTEQYEPVDKYNISVASGKNLIDANNLLYGYFLSSGEMYESPLGIMSNLIELKQGETYTMQGIPYYGSGGNIYIGFFDENLNYVGRTYYPAQNKINGRGDATFIFDNLSNVVKYIRIVLQTSTSSVYEPELAQLELGNIASDYEPFMGQIVFKYPRGQRRLRILSVGNSYSHDALDYLPFLLKEIAPEIELTLGILYLSGATLQNHYNNYMNEEAAYIYSMYNGGYEWYKETEMCTIQSKLDDYEWDIVLLQQGSTSSWNWGTYQPYLNDLINLISNRVNYPIKFGWLLTQSRPKVGDTVYDDETILLHFADIATNAKKVIDETLCEFVIPVGTAVQNARTTILNNIGDYGKLCSADGGHLQEGLPVQLAGYVCVLSILQLCGIPKSVIGEQTIVTETWRTTRKTPSPNGTAVGSTKENCLIAQKCAVMAMKFPFVITNMDNLNV